MMHIWSCLIGGGISAVISYYNGYFENFSQLWIFFAMWFVLYVVTIIATLLGLYVISLFLKMDEPEKPGMLSLFLVNQVMAFICQLANIKIHIKNIELVDKKRKYLIVFNHRSRFDNMIMGYKLSYLNPIMISKPENFKIPLAGPFINRAGFLAIDRDNDREALRTIIKASHFLMSENVSVGICPEGTRNLESRELLPFRSGAFKIATKVKAPILVLTFEGTEKIHKLSPLRRTHVYLDILKVIEPEEYENMNTRELSEEIKHIMQENLDTYAPQVEESKKQVA